MYDILRHAYWILERMLIRFLPPRTQHVLRDSVVKITNDLFPGRLLVRDANELEAVVQVQSWLRPALPDWVLEELAEISDKIDPNLHPQGEWVASAEFYSAPWTYSLPGDRYFDLKKRLAGEWDLILFVPWLKSGGADLGAIHFANAVAGSFGKRVAVIATENTSSLWSDRLAPEVRFVEAGGLLTDLHEAHQLDVLVRLLLQVAPHAIHVMNSRLAWEAIKRNGLAIRQQSRIFASLYCDDVSASGQRVGYARQYLASCHHMLDGVISDNPVMPAQWHDQIGVRSELFHVVRFPAPDPHVRFADEYRPATPARILWAGRLDRQKRPDLLAEVARRMPHVTFDVYGHAVMMDGQPPALEDIPNIVMHGPYERFADLLAEAPVAYLYTSQWDGMPNVLLEAASAGLPIVASDVGGISDFLASDQLVRPFDDADGYVSRLHQLIEDPALAQAWRARQFGRASQMHSRKSFADSIAAIPGYLQPFSADEVDAMRDRQAGNMPSRPGLNETGMSRATTGASNA